MKKVQQGFTLIELMIVVAIIGILAAVALPAYQDYTKRSHVTEGLGLAAGAKAAVTEYYSTNGSFPTTNSAAGLAASTQLIGNAVTSVAVGTGGVITVTFNAKVENAKTIALTPTAGSGNIQWRCAPPTSGGINPKYAPSSCRS